MNPEQPAPQAQPTEPAPQPTPTMPTPMPTTGSGMSANPMGGAPKGNKKNILLAIIAAAVLLVAAAAYGAYAYVTNTPDYVFKQAISQTNLEDPFAAKFKINSSQGGTGITVSGDIAAQVDADNHKNGKMVLGFGAGDSRVSATVAFIDEALYFKLGDLDHIGKLAKSFGSEAEAVYGSPEFLAVVSKLNGQWFTLSKDDIKGFVEQTTGGNEATGSFSVEDLKTLKKIYDRHSFVRPDKVFADEDVDGVKSAHFSIKPDKNEMVAFLKDVKDANLKSFKVTDEDLTKAQNDPVTDDKTAVEVWVARDTKKLRQLQVATTESGQNTTITVTMLANIPQLEKLQKPTDAKPVSEIYTILFGASYSQYLNSAGSDGMGGLDY